MHNENYTKKLRKTAAFLTLYLPSIRKIIVKWRLIFLKLF